MNVLWLRPTTGDNISVGRERIGEKLESRGINVDIQNSSRLDLFSAVKKAIGGDYDVIVGTTRIGLYSGFVLSKLLCKPFLGDVADPIRQINSLPTPLYRFFGWYENYVLKRTDVSTFVYQSSYQRALEHGVNGVKVNNGVDYELFTDPDEQTKTKAKKILTDTGVTFEKPIVMYIGGLTEIYNISKVLEASLVVKTWDFVFIGEGSLQDNVSAAADRYDNVHYPGAFNYSLMPGFLHWASAGLCLVDAEQPLKVLEYGAANLPVIASEGELRNRFAEDELLFVNPTPDEIATALQRVSDRPELADRYSSKLNERAKECQWDNIAETYYELIMEISS